MWRISCLLKTTAAQGLHIGGCCFDNKLQSLCWNLLLVVISPSLGCLVFPPMVLSNFLGGCSNHEKTINKKAHLDNVHEGWLNKHCVWFNLHAWKCVQYLAEPTAATRKGCWCAFQQKLEKTKQTNNKNCSESVWSEVHAWSIFLLVLTCLEKIACFLRICH